MPEKWTWECPRSATAEGRIPASNISALVEGRTVISSCELSQNQHTFTAFSPYKDSLVMTILMLLTQFDSNSVLKGVITVLRAENCVTPEQPSATKNHHKLHIGKWQWNSWAVNLLGKHFSLTSKFYKLIDFIKLRTNSKQEGADFNRLALVGVHSSSSPLIP